MKRLSYIVLTSALALMPVYVAAYEYNAFGGDQDDCFAKAMIGMDSVINSRLGVPAEHALDLTVLQPAGSDSNTYDNDTLNVILSAYLWEDSPHSYAVRVFYKCAQQKVYSQQASME